MSGLLLGTVGGAAVAVCGAASCIWQVLHDLKLQQELLLPLLPSCVRTLRTVLTHATIRYILKVTFGLIRTPGAMMAYCLGEFEVLPSRTCRLFNPFPPYRFTDTENRLSVAFCKLSVHLCAKHFSGFTGLNLSLSQPTFHVYVSAQLYLVTILALCT